MGKKGSWFSAIKKAFTPNSKEKLADLYIRKSLDPKSSDTSSKLLLANGSGYSDVSKMGKKGSWFSAIKKAFTPNSKEKLADGTDKKSSKEKKKRGFGKLKHGDSFIPLFREPSSIEKILGEAERENQVRNFRPSTPPEQPKAPSHIAPPPRRNANPTRATASPKAHSPPRVASPPRDVPQRSPPRVITPPIRRVASTPPFERVASTRGKAATTVNVTAVNDATRARTPPPRFVQRQRPEPSLREQHICATKIQAAYRGYTARRSYKSVRGLARLQRVVKGQNVKRQTANALKCMQVLVRVQNQIKSRRIEILDNQAQQRQVLYKNDKDLDSAFAKYMSEHRHEWDDSPLTKEEIEARMKRKFDAIVNRERAMAYSHSHQSWKGAPRTVEAALMGVRAGGLPYWWKWLDQGKGQGSPMTPTNPSQSRGGKSFHLTPTRSMMDKFKASPLPHSSPFSQSGRGFDHLDTPTPTSTRSTIPSRAKLSQTPPPRLHHKFPRRGSFGNSPFRDDDSLMSCPAFSVPRYMSPTQSAKAKAKPSGKEQLFSDSPASTSDGSKRRVSYPMDNSPGSIKWKQSPLFSNKTIGRAESVQSVGNLSVDSTASSMPVSVGRKPFNRYA